MSSRTQWPGRDSKRAIAHGFLPDGAVANKFPLFLVLDSRHAIILSSAGGFL